MNLDFYLQQPFAQHALLAGAMVAVTCGLIGRASCRERV